MLFKFLAVTGLTMMFALPVAAQSTQSQSSGSSNSGQQPGMGQQSGTGQDNMNIQQHVKQNLEQAGFPSDLRGQVGCRL